MLICLKTFKAETLVDEVFSVSFFKGLCKFFSCVFETKFFVNVVCLNDAIRTLLYKNFNVCWMFLLFFKTLAN